MIIEKILPLIFVFLLGIFLKKKGVLRQDDSRILSKLLIFAVLPVLLINTFSKITIERQLILLPLSSAIVILSLFVLGFVFSYILGLKDKTRGSFIATFPTFEGGLVTYIFMLAAFGELGLAKIVLFDVANVIFVFTVVYFISYKLGRGSEGNIKDGIAEILKSPIIWSILVGIFLNLIKFQNDIISNFLDIASAPVLFLAMLFLGLEFKMPSLISLKLPLINVFLKTGFGLALGWLVSLLFGFEGLEKAAVMVGVSAPPSIMTLIFARENDLDAEYSANLLSLAIPFSMIFILILLNLL